MTKMNKILLRRRIVYITYNIILLSISYFLSRFVQMLVFVLFYNTIQNCFNYRFHSDTIFYDNPIKAVRYCKLITIVVEIIYLCFCKEFEVSVYSNLFIIFLIALLNALLQFYLERVIISSSILHNKSLLLTRCNEIGLTTEAINRLILHYIEHKTIKEIANNECVEIATIKQSIRRSLRKLGL